MDNNVTITFEHGTLIIDGPESIFPYISSWAKYDHRVKFFRAKACNYRDIVLALLKKNIPYQDNAKNYSPLPLSLHSNIAPREYQIEALKAWWKEGNGRGIVELPTGAGKSYLAIFAIAKVQRPSLIIVPTIDLMQQWASGLEAAFRIKTGLFGGGCKDIRPITVTTYDSAVLQMEFIGNRFGFVIFDECHHLPGPVNRTSAIMCIAPYRLGLSATPESGDIESDNVLFELVGQIVYKVHIDELEGNVLSPYRVTRINTSLTREEEAEYRRNRQIYTNFLKMYNITFNDARDWGKFIGLCSRLPGGRDVYKAYLAQKKIARTSKAKISAVWNLIKRHYNERIIIFTADNDTAYLIGRNFCLPVITHRTKISERKEFLDNFRKGLYSVLITSKVLNEGIDVPEASVGIIVSGSGSIREHVQRLGRILRGMKDKQAVLYEIVSINTAERNISERRRQHRAYRIKK